LRYVVTLLNFADLGSAAVYQRTAIASLQAMHRRCHPAEGGCPAIEADPAD
jgi:site-specific recombinase XerD